MKISANGKIVWKKTIGSTQNLHIYDVMLKDNKHMIIAGQAHYNFFNLQENKEIYFLFLMAMDTNGNIAHQKAKQVLKEVLKRK
jgi:hypothetical protein